MANIVRERKNGNVTYYNVNEHLNPTNVCVYRCTFCAFRADSKARTALRDVGRADHRKRRGEATSKGARNFTSSADCTTSCRTSGIWTSSRIPRRVSGSSSEGVDRGRMGWFERARSRPTKELLAEMKAAGLGSCPAAARRSSTPTFARRSATTKPMDPVAGSTANGHELGCKSNATMLYGHIEKRRTSHRPPDAAAAACRTRPAASRPSSRWRSIRKTLRSQHHRKPSGMMDLKVMAISRLMLDNFPHIKAYWQMLTAKIAQSRAASARTTSTAPSFTRRFTTRPGQRLRKACAARNEAA